MILFFLIIFLTFNVSIDVPKLYLYPANAHLVKLSHLINYLVKRIWLNYLVNAHLVKRSFG